MLTEVVEMTLCAKEDGKNFHSEMLNYVERECDNCGVEKFELHSSETSTKGIVEWSRYEYIPTRKYLPDGQQKKKIAFVQKEMNPSQLFNYFKELLMAYPAHSFKAQW